MDLACTLSLGVLVLLFSVAYGLRVALRGRAGHARVEAEGESALVPKSLMEMMYWGAEPVVSLCVKLGITPDTITYGSLVLGVLAGSLFAVGHFGIGALAAVVGAAGDTLDGLLARRLKAASLSGEVLDAAVDRYVDFALIAGLAIFFRDQTAPLVVALLAMLAAFMVSYSSAKADALGVAPPRGSMRRAERCVLVIGAAALTPATALLGTPGDRVPLLLALAAIGVFGNASAIRRLASIRSGVSASRSPVKGAARAAASSPSSSRPRGREAQRAAE